MIDLPALLDVPQRFGRPPRILDVACGTGILLNWLLEQLCTSEDLKGAEPSTINRGSTGVINHALVEAYGVDASEDMLTQARTTLQQWPHVHLQRMEFGTSKEFPTINRGTTTLLYQPQTFDLITCTNALHYFPDLQATLAALAQLLAPTGQLVLQDYRERELLLVSHAFKWLVRRFDPKHVRTYSLQEACSLCIQAGLSIVCQKTFAIDWICDGWALRVCVL